MMFAIMDGLELQWLLDPTVDMVALFDHYLDEAIERWRLSPVAAPCRDGSVDVGLDAGGDVGGGVE